MIHAESAPTELACLGIARCQMGLSQAFSLVYHNYLEAGLVEPNPAQARVLPQHALSSTEVFVAKIRNEVFGTATLVRDSALGLPMESIYAREIADRRDQHVHLAEVSCLADRRSTTSRRSLIDLMVFTIQCAKLRGVDNMLIAVHPRHVKFYINYLGFHVFAGLRTYDAVRGNPAVGLCLDLISLETCSPEAYHRIFGRRSWSEQLAYQPLAPEAKRYVERLLRAFDPNVGYSCQPASIAS